MTNIQETKMTIEDRIEQAREAAHQAGEKFGKTSPEFAVAMEIWTPTERATPKFSRTLLFG
jgi:hypothetical protein